MMDTYAKIRKSRKKLRQIENLESIDRDLTDEEVSKCMKKESIREELLELLLLYNSQSGQTESDTDLNSSIATSATSADASFSTAVLGSPLQTDTQELDDHAESFTETPVNTNNSYSTEQIEVKLIGDNYIQERSIKDNKPVDTDIQKRLETKEKYQESDKRTTVTTTDTSEQKRTPSPSKKTKAKKVGKEKSAQTQWATKEFTISILESHSDLVTAVDCCDGLLVSASRDTTVKVWDLSTLAEVCSLGSHTGSVTDVVILPKYISGKLGASITVTSEDHVILSGSTDCSLNVWSAKTGELLKSVYTYNPITKVTFYPDKQLAVTGSDGGKLELWNLDTKENVCSEMAHSDSITGLCVSDGKILTSCAVDGEVKVFEMRDNKLYCIYASENTRNLSGDAITLRHIRSLGVKGENIYFGDDGVNVKCLTWKKGLVRKLANHKEEFGMTDAICFYDNLMITSAYDLDNGHGYMNVFDSSADPVYISTLDFEDTRRILDICCYSNSPDFITIVTAGLDLQVWTQVTSNSGNEDTVNGKYIASLSQPAQDSDIESDVEFTDSESEAGDSTSSRRGSVNGQSSSWMSWCTLT